MPSSRSQFIRVRGTDEYRAAVESLARAGGHATPNALVVALLAEHARTMGAVLPPSTGRPPKAKAAVLPPMPLPTPMPRTAAPGMRLWPVYVLGVHEGDVEAETKFKADKLAWQEYGPKAKVTA